MAASVDSHTMVFFLAHVEKCWRKLGETEPHWSVLTDPAYAADRIGDTERDFFDTGRGMLSG